MGIKLYQAIQVATADNNDTGEPIKILNIKELGNYLQVSESCIRKWMAAGDGFPSPFTLGASNRLYWDISDIDDWIQMNKDVAEVFRSGEIDRLEEEVKKRHGHL